MMHKRQWHQVLKIITYRQNKDGVCLTARPNVAISINYNNDFLYEIFTLNVTNVQDITIPNNLLFDEDGSPTTDLTSIKTIIRFSNGTSLDGRYWIGVYPSEPSSETKIYMVCMDNALVYAKSRGYGENKGNYLITNVYLYFTDAGGFTEMIIMKIKMGITVPRSYYTVEFSFSVIGIAQQIYTLQIRTFLKLLHQSFGIDYKYLIYMRFYYLIKVNGDDGNGMLRWSLIMDDCDLHTN